MTAAFPDNIEKGIIYFECLLLLTFKTVCSFSCAFFANISTIVFIKGYPSPLQQLISRMLF